MTAIYNASDRNYRLGVNKNPKDGDQAVFSEFGYSTSVIPGWNIYPDDSYYDVNQETGLTNLFKFV